MKTTLFLISLLVASAYTSSAWVQAGEAPLTGGPKLVDTTTTTTTTKTYPDGRTHTDETTTKTNPDGSTTTTVTQPDGSTDTYTTTTKPNADGSTTTTKTNPDGSTTTTKTYPPYDGSTYTTTTKTDPNGDTREGSTTTKTNADGSTTTTGVDAGTGTEVTYTTTTKTNADGSTATTITYPDGDTYTTTTKTNADGSTTTTDPGGSTTTTTTTTTQRFSDGSSVVKQPDGKIISYGPGEGPTEPERAILDFEPTEPYPEIDPGTAPTIKSSFQLSLDEADNKTAGVPKPSEETQKVEEKKQPSWWESLIPSIGIGIGGGRGDSERRFPDDPRR